MIDICTVVFNEELSILRTQAESIGLYCQNIGVRNIYVVINDDETLVNEIDPAWWGPLASAVLVVPRSAFSTPWVADGWISQQVFKMLAPSMSYNTWTMVLDAKTVVVADMEITRLIDDQGRLRVGFMPIQPVFQPSQEIAQRFFGVNLKQQIGPAGVPFFFHNDTLRAMIVDISIKAKESFPAWFQRQGRLTEFIAYSAFVEKAYGRLDVLYSPECAVFPVNICHSDLDKFDTKITAMKESTSITVSIHREAWKKLSPEQQNQYRMLLMDRNLITSWDL